ncbi:hypothetical protein BGW42_003728 [Actinomortierella wolfii]|nr:hypothetical protein BGW42_003728 [Actinomortierella wolfii]
MSALNSKSPRFPIESLELSFCPNDEKFEEAVKSTHSDWGEAFPLETWVANHKWMVNNLDYCNSKCHKRWIVTSRDDPQRAVLCSAAYFERPALMAYKKTKTKKKGEAMPHIVDGGTTAVAGAIEHDKIEDGEGGEDEQVETKVIETKSAHVAMVCTVKQHRGNGYASWMMYRIWEYFEQQREFPFTYLYSDAGDMYVRMGWKRFPANTLDIPVDHLYNFPFLDRSIPSTTTTTNRFQLQLVTSENLDEVMQWDTALVRDEVAQRIQEAEAGTTMVALLPDSRSVLWQRARSRFFLEEQQRRSASGGVGGDSTGSSLSLGPYGATLNRTATAEGPPMRLGYVLWCHDFRNEQLILFRLRYPSPSMTVRALVDDVCDENEPAVDSLPQQVALILLQEALEEAKRWGLPKVTLWNAPSAIGAWLRLESYERTRYLPCLGLCAHPDTPVSEHAPTDKIEWILNEFYAY